MRVTRAVVFLAVAQTNAILVRITVTSTLHAVTPTARSPVRVTLATRAQGCPARLLTSAILARITVTATRRALTRRVRLPVPAM